MRTKSVTLALLLAATAVAAHAQNATPAAERNAPAPAPTMVGRIDDDAMAVQRAARTARSADVAPRAADASAFSVFTYDVLGATPRLQIGKRAAPAPGEARPAAGAR